MGIQIFKGSDTTLKLLQFKNKKTNTLLTGKTVTVELWEKINGTARLGAVITLTDNSDADYYGNVADDHADLVAGMRLNCKLSADGGGGLMCYKEADGSVLVARQR